MTTKTQDEMEQGGDLNRFSNVKNDGGETVTVSTELYHELMDEWAVPEEEIVDTQGYSYITFSKNSNPEMWGYDVPRSTWSSTDGSEGLPLKDHGTSEDWDRFRKNVETSARRIEEVRS